MILSSNAEDLRHFFASNSGSSLDIKETYTSLKPNHSVLLNKTIRLDKLIIVIYSNDSFNIREEFSTLENIISNNNFFKVSEIELFVEKGELSEETINIFKFSMESIEFKNYTIHSSESKLTSLYIYKKVLDIQSESTKKTKINKVYRSVIGEESKVGYTPVKTDYNKMVEEEDTNIVYEEYKNNISKVDTGNLRKEIEENIIPKQDIELDLFKSNMSRVKNVSLISGTKMSGTSLITSNLVSNSNNTLLIDLTSRGKTLYINNIIGDCTEVVLSELLLGVDYLEEGNKIISVNDKSYMYQLLKFLNTSPNRINYNKMLIECDLEDLRDLEILFSIRVDNVFITMNNKKSDLDNLNEYNIGRADLIFINTFFPSGVGDYKIDSYDIELSYPNSKVNIVSDLEIHTIKVGV